MSDPKPSPDPRASGFRLTELLSWAALAAYAVLLLLLRPASVSTPGEGALLLALRGGGSGSGATPAWWLLGRGLGRLGVEPFLGWQVIGGLTWALGVASLFGLWARRIPGLAPPCLAAAMLATWPPLVFRAGMATPEAAGIGLATAAIACLSKVASTGRGVWPGFLLAAGAVLVLPGACWIVLPVAGWVVWRAWTSERRRAQLLAAALVVGATGAAWVAWRWLGPAGAPPEVGGAAWLAVAGSPWLSVTAALLAGWGAAIAWRLGHRDLVGFGVAGVALATVGAIVDGRSGGIVLAAPWLSVLAGAVGLTLARGRWWGIAAVGVWSAAAVIWTWPAISARRQPAPAWAALDWARQNLDPMRTVVVLDPDLEPLARLLLAPAGFRLAPAGSQAAAEIAAAGHEVVNAGPIAEVGSEVLKAWRWPSGRVQRLVTAADSRCVLTRTVSTDRATFSREWSRTGERWDLEGEGTVSLEPGAEARRLVIALDEGEVEIRTAGLRAFRLGPTGKKAISVPVYPGPAGAVAVRARATSARFSTLHLERFDPTGQDPAEVLVPQAAAVSGIGGSYWQTDLTLVNPNGSGLSVELLFMPSDQANPTARFLRLELAAGASSLVENVLARREFLGGPRTGAMLARSAGCNAPACGIMVVSRTYNVQGSACDAIGEGLPGLAAASGLRPGQHAVFEDVANDNEHRGYLGFASWGGSRVEVHAVLRASSGEVLGEMNEGLEPWSHRHLRLPRPCSGVRLEVEVRGPADALVFPYLSTVQSARNCTAHRYPDRVEGGSRGPAPGPRDPELMLPDKPGG
ncbi:MAG TPA: hypothetical protein PLS53_03035 [Thermoanaerobaculaceae bacterium]|nr:hypothetical protein [Thermoanaerobaculaceae bacterium]